MFSYTVTRRWLRLVLLFPARWYITIFLPQMVRISSITVFHHGELFKQGQRANFVWPPFPKIWCYLISFLGLIVHLTFNLPISCRTQKLNHNWSCRSYTRMPNRVQQEIYFFWDVCRNTNNTHQNKIIVLRNI